MTKASQPELKKVFYAFTIRMNTVLTFQKFMDKKLFVHLQGGRKVSGVLRGYDLFLNLVLDDAHEEPERHSIGTVVRIFRFIQMIYC